MLHRRLPVIDAATFKFVAGVVVLMNPIAMLPQLVQALTAPPKELLGVSISMFFIFAAIQAAVVASAIRARDSALFLSMVISVIETTLIIVVLLVRVPLT